MSHMNYSCHYNVCIKLCPGHPILFLVMKRGVCIG